MQNATDETTMTITDEPVTRPSLEPILTPVADTALKADVLRETRKGTAREAELLAYIEHQDRVAVTNAAIIKGLELDVQGYETTNRWQRNEVNTLNERLTGTIEHGLMFMRVINQMTRRLMLEFTDYAAKRDDNGSLTLTCKSGDWTFTFDQYTWKFTVGSKKLGVNPIDLRVTTNGMHEIDLLALPELLAAGTNRNTAEQVLPAKAIDRLYTKPADDHVMQGLIEHLTQAHGLGGLGFIDPMGIMVDTDQLLKLIGGEITIEELIASQGANSTRPGSFESFRRQYTGRSTRREYDNRS